MLVLDICWMTVWWRVTVPQGDKQRAQLCPVVFHLVRLKHLHLLTCFTACFFKETFFVLIFLCIQGAVRAQSSVKRCLGQLLRGKVNISVSLMLLHHMQNQKIPPTLIWSSKFQRSASGYSCAEWIAVKSHKHTPSTALLLIPLSRPSCTVPPPLL